MAAYDRGQSIKLITAFTDANGDAASPTTVVCKVEKPDGTETTYTDISTPAIANPSTGTYTLVIVADQSGMWSYRWTGTTGTTVAVDEQQFHVLGSVFA